MKSKLKTKKQIVQELKEALKDLQKYRPFVGKPHKDYYRGQWDSLSWVLEELLGE